LKIILNPIAPDFAVSQYQYSAIAIEAKEIRLLTLLPGASDETVKTVLNAVILTADDLPRYEALSYTGGSRDQHKDIFIGSDILVIT
jgi:hypothetical protein